MKVSIQGIKGAFHEEAARKYFNNDIDIIPHMTFEDLTNSVYEANSDYGVIAVENSISGTIHANLSLIREANLNICGEIYLRIKQNLAVIPGSRLEDLDQVQSHYMAINQCRKFFSKNTHIKLIDAEDTALSMKHISDFYLKNEGAIGSKLAADYYGLEVIAEGIETNKRNYTRFLIIEKEKENSKSTFNKASLAVTIINSRGSLSQFLSVISYHDIDLSKIESAPLIGEPWHYVFFMDILFDNIENYNNMLIGVKPFVNELQIMGEYTSGIKSLNNIHKR